MKLSGDFFRITEAYDTADGFGYAIDLNPAHFIYRAHFPGNPVTPGVCIIQICRELMERRMQRPLSVRRAFNVKFLAVVNPETCGALRVDFSKIAIAADGCKASVSVYRDDVQFAKASLFFRHADTPADAGEAMKRAGACLIIPTYNNDASLAAVLDAVLQYTQAVIVVNDGSTDGTAETLARYRRRIEIVAYTPNRGKGYALRRGFDRAEQAGYACALTMDSDGQHDARDIGRFAEALRRHSDSLIVGSRSFRPENMPARNTFANRFSNFWFTVQTGFRLPDTQSGFRLYPLARMKGMRPLTSRYEAELELLVRAAWRNIPILPIPIRVHYPPEGERVTHFRPGMDFARISLLNTLCVFGAIFYGYPSRLFRRLIRR
ncbi:MAG: glycosyltransferase [Tannerella sp.]|jgi:3-hydroxymyristoyl/3-hydroxydecanoyl-(acyl carrier protein) dehydratase|nr:glycosyltransferase [Tannerella sp.]